MLRTKCRSGLLLLLVCALSAADSGAQTPDPLVGTWTGALDAAPNVKLRVAFNMTVDAAGQRTVTMDSPDQGVKGIPVASAELKDGTVTIVVPAIAGTYTGRMSADGKSIEGTWSQGGASLPLRLERSAPSS